MTNHDYDEKLRLLKQHHVIPISYYSFHYPLKPGSIRVDNVPEFIISTLEAFFKDQGITWQFIKPGKPMQNGFVERLNRTFREDVLDAYPFNNLKQVREISEEWLSDYNVHHPHQSLQG